MSTMTREITSPESESPAREQSATIASISDQEWSVTRTYGAFRIPACARGEACALLVVTPRGDAIDLGDNHRFPFTIGAREIAEDITKDLGDHGVFVCAGAKPAEAELAQARARRDAWHKRLVAEADEMWARGHSYREISDMHRRAAQALGLEREWAYVPQRQVDCPACGEKVKPGVALCKHCGAVLDAERAGKYFPNAAREHSGAGNAALAPSAARRKPIES
jgi:zinc-ribbon domain